MGIKLFKNCVIVTCAGWPAPRGSAVTASPSLKVKAIWLTGVILVMVYLSPPSLETSNLGLAFTSVVYLSPLLPIFRDSKFYSKKVIQIWGSMLSTEISHVKNFIQIFYPNFFYPKCTRLILPHFINENYTNKYKVKK